MADMSIREFQRRFKAGEFNKKYDKKKLFWLNREQEWEEKVIQCEAGWYDWFCRDSSLAGKTKKLGSVACQLKDSAKVNLDTMYVWFKNNCPMEGPLYDDFRIADMESGEVLYNCAYKSPHEDGVNWAVYGKENDFKTLLQGFDNAREMVKWFNESKAG
jgi:hypothetical protein